MMPAIILDQTNRLEILSPDHAEKWIVACLCADWCDVCKQYQAAFHGMADSNPHACFVWIDIEDHADLVGDLDVENFPTLLIQQGDTVHFFGAVLPDIHIAERLLASYRTSGDMPKHSPSAGNALKDQWQAECNLRKLLQQSLS